METKPFSLQAPEAIAKEYAGNKQKIAQAAQMGIVDPTAAVLAGMFIDRMRNAAQAEAAPQQTVAQQVFAPPAPAAPPAGLGALPQGAMPPEAMAGMPQAMPQGMPQGMPQEAMMPPQGMPAPEAMMAEGGLAGLEVPDDMFMESDNYAGGGMVAFAGAGEAKLSMAKLADLIPGVDYAIPDYAGALGQAQSMFGTPGGPALDEYKALLLSERGPEAQKRNKKQGLAEFLAQLGFGMAAGKSPDFLSNLAGAAAPAGQAAIANVKERKKEERQLLKDQVDMELSEYGVKTANVKAAIDIANQAASLQNQGLDRKNSFMVSADSNANNLEVARTYAGAKGAKNGLYTLDDLGSQQNKYIEAQSEYEAAVNAYVPDDADLAKARSKAYRKYFAEYNKYRNMQGYDPISQGGFNKYVLGSDEANEQQIAPKLSAKEMTEGIQGLNYTPAVPKDFNPVPK
jgi:hypothetical protein